uniref:hypothetical protein n=1 Tax=Falsiroseomonas oryzae TaxID=2766473 RepID=UPI0022EA2C18
MRRLVLLLALLALPAPAALACGPESDCPVGDRAYRIRMPDAVAPGTRVGAVLFAHGAGGRATDTMGD